MDRIINITKWIFNPFLVQKPGQVKVVALCIAVATTFWFLNAFNKTYTTTLAYPLSYKYDHEKFTPLEELDQTIDISLTGQGWNLLKEAFSLEDKTISISPDKLPGAGFIKSETILDSTTEMLSKFEIKRVFADSIKYNFDYKVSKLIKLILPADSIKLENGYAIVTEVEIEPNEIYITGASKILDTIPINYILTIDDEIDDDFDDEVSLHLPNEVITDQSEVNVSFEIQPYIEIVAEIQYNILNLQDSTLEFKPETLDLKIYTTEKYEDSIVDSMFVVDLNLLKFEFKNDTFLHPKITSKIPDYIKRVVLEDSTIYISKP